MQKRRKYRATNVKDVALESLLAAAPPQGAAAAGLDISKFEAFAVMRWRNASFERPWKAAIPSQMKELVNTLRRIAKEQSVRKGILSHANTTYLRKKDSTAA